MLNSSVSTLTQTLNSREDTIEKLLNRLQAGDLKTLLSLNTNASTELPDVKYTSSHDIKELEIITQGQGLGMELYDDGSRDSEEFGAFAAELGIPYDAEPGRG